MVGTQGCYQHFCDSVLRIVRSLKLGCSLHDPAVDCGAICLPQQLLYYQALVDDAVRCGATILIGGRMLLVGDTEALAGTFYPPTVLGDVPEGARIMQEEIFGPIMCITKALLILPTRTQTAPYYMHVPMYAGLSQPVSQASIAGGG